MGLAHLFEIDSAGTSDFHVGERPHAGSIQIAERHGISIIDQRGRQFTREDLNKWDYIIVMDESNKQNLLTLDKAIKGKLYRLRDFDPHGPGNVPDPWGRGEDAFQEVYTIIYRSCEKLLNHILREHEGAKS
jgi:protein-tyrosine phosphatase